MHGLAASAFFFVMVMLLAAPLGPALPNQLVGQASAGEPDQVPSAERTQSPSATPSKGAPSVASICDALVVAAGENDLPVDFFARLIWQESRFDPTAVSRAGAQGVAQFMPATANSRGLADPFDPIESIAHSAKPCGTCGVSSETSGSRQPPTMRDRGGFAISLPAGVAYRGRPMRM
jgi:soluble lytic murein transglycosylase-like protein